MNCFLAHLAAVAIMLAGCSRSMRLPEPSTLGSIHPEPHRTWHFELAASIDDQRAESVLTTYDAPVLSPDERSVTLIQTRLMWTEASDEPIVKHEMRLYELPAGTLVDSRSISEQEQKSWNEARWRAQNNYSIAPRDTQQSPPWRLDIQQACTLVNDSTGQRHEIFAANEYRCPQHRFRFSPDGKYLVGWFIGGPSFFGGDRTKPHIRVWDVAEGTLLAWWVINQPWPDGFDAAGFIAGTNVMVFRGRGWAALFDLDSRSRLDSIGTHGDSIVTSDMQTTIIEWQGIRIYRLVSPHDVP